MKTCPKCQFIGNENEVYCVKCGTLLEETASEVPQGAPEAQEVPQTPPPYVPYTYPQPKEEVSLGKWILYYLIPYIPFVGGLVFLVMLFIWGFGSDKNETFRNWAKAQLIIMAIGVGLMVLIFLLLFLVLGHTVADVVTEFTPY